MFKINSEKVYAEMQMLLIFIDKIATAHKELVVYHQQINEKHQKDIVGHIDGEFSRKLQAPGNHERDALREEDQVP